MKTIACASMRGAILLTLLILFAPAASAQTGPREGGRRFPDRADRTERSERAERAEPRPNAAEKASTASLAVTRHSITIDHQPFEYTALTGTLPLRDDAGKPEADIFSVTYYKGTGQPDPARPLVFFFNGGPGAAAIWLHVGGLGPRRVVMEQAGTVLPERHELADNPDTPLTAADLVFVDPIGTGFSRAAEGVDAKRYYDHQEDTRVLARFIRLYITQHRRWLSPFYLAGESYGATRAAAIAQRLQSGLGLYPRGVILISSVLDFQAISPGGGNDLPYVLGLPSCAAAAWYHKKIAPAQQSDLERTLAEAERWAIQEYLPALARGDALPEDEAGRIADRLAGFTGLPRQLILNHDLRVDTMTFARELLRDEGRFLGFMDGRVIGVAVSRSSQYESYDPAFFLAIGPYVATFNDYVRRELQYQTTLNYEYLSSEVHGAWRYDAQGQYLDVTDELGKAMAANSRLRVLNAAGVYDLTTPYFGQEYSINHIGLDPRLRGNVTCKRYRSGHQIYTALEESRRLNEDIAAFLK